MPEIGPNLVQTFEMKPKEIKVYFLFLMMVILTIEYGDVKGPKSGYTRVFKWDTSSYMQQGSIIMGKEGFDESGSSVSLSSNGNIVAVDAPKNNANEEDSARVRIYELSGNDWSQVRLDIDGEFYFDQIEILVSLFS